LCTEPSDYVNDRITNRSCIGAVIDNGVVIADNLDKANAFNYGRHA